MIVPLWKPIGVSTHSFVKAYGDQIQNKITHTGSLDPMAEGVVVALTAEDRFLKEKYTNTEKEYKFEILVGVSTDSHDLLGLITDYETNHLSTEEITDKINIVLSKLTGRINQVIPDFSAKRINGESYYDLAKRGDVLPKVTEPVTFHSLGILDLVPKDKNEIFQQIQIKINLVQGEFHQNEILQRWEQYFNDELNNETELVIIKLSAVTSKRTYMRGLVRDLSNILNISMLVYSLIRTKNGNYSKVDCNCK